MTYTDILKKKKNQRKRSLRYKKSMKEKGYKRRTWMIPLKHEHTITDFINKLKDEEL